MANTKQTKGVSLAKGPVLIVGIALLAYGVLALIFGGHGFELDFPSGTENGKQFLGLEGNAWTNLLFIGAGALLIFGAPLHWGAKGTSLVVGLVLGAASVIALVDGDDVLGIFAANGLTKLVWGAAAALLIILALLPRVGGKDKEKDEDDAHPPRSERRLRREPAAARETAPRDSDRESRTPAGKGSVVAPAAGTTAESRDTSRRQDNGEI